MKNKILLFFISILLLNTLLETCGYGFDITDEGFYLATINTPNSNPPTTSQFGFVFHPLWKALNFNVVLFRQLNLLILFYLAWHLLFLILTSDTKKRLKHSIAEASISSILALIVFVQLYIWLPTPNYNSLNLISLLIASIGVILATKTKNLSGYTLVGIGGYLCFMAKPTSAIALATSISVLSAYSFIINKNKKKTVTALTLATLISASLLGLYAITTTGSITAFIDSLLHGIANGKLLLGDSWGNTSNLFWKGRIETNRPSFWTSAYLLMIAISSSTLLIKHPSFYKTHLITTCFTGFSSLLVTALVLVNQVTNPLLNLPTSEQFLLVWLTILIISITLIAVSIIKQRYTNIAQALLLLSMPYIYAFGTSNSYLSVMTHVVIFGVAAILALIKSLDKNKQTSLTLLVTSCSLSLTLLSIHSSLEKPYRQIIMPKLHNAYSNNQFTTMSGERLKGLKLPPNIANYFNVLSHKAKQSGFKENTPIIDMTGASPGVLFALGGKNIGAAWLLGGYSGSEKFAIKVLKRIPKAELNTAWLLFEENWKRSLPESVLKAIGKSLSDYTLIAEVNIPSGFGGRAKDNKQRLYKPKPPQN